MAATSAGSARRDTELFLTNCQGIPEDLSDDAVLLASELVANASTAMKTGPFPGPPCIELSLRLFDDYLLIEVIDSAPGTPAPNLTDDAAREEGRGLTVVHRLSQEWGYFPRTVGKVVFCKLTIHPREENRQPAPPPSDL